MSSGLRWLLIGLATLGVCGLIAGLIGDLNCWWTNLGFTSNVLAGATGACFGIPFAVLVLQRFLQEDQGRERRRSLAGRIRRNFETMQREIPAICGELVDHMYLESNVWDSASGQICKLRDPWVEAPESKHRSPKQRPEAGEWFRQNLEQIETALTLLKRVWGDVLKLHGFRPGGSDPTASLFALVGSWRLLSEELIPSLEEHGILFPHPQRLGSVNKYVEAVVNTTQGRHHWKRIDELYQLVSTLNSWRVRGANPPEQLPQQIVDIWSKWREADADVRLWRDLKDEVDFASGQAAKLLETTG